MDLSTLALSQKAELELTTPDGKPSGLVFVLLSDDSQEVRSRRSQYLKAVREKAAAGEQADEQELEQYRMGDRVTRTVDWYCVDGSDFTHNGEPLKCDAKTTEWLYSQPEYRWIADQIDRWAGNRANFMQRPLSNSESTPDSKPGSTQSRTGKAKRGDRQGS